mgnify:CR=1 FL=1
MPKAPKRPCRYPGCPNLCDKGVYCSKHMEFSSDRRRGGAESRGYDSRWRKVRAAFLQRGLHRRQWLTMSFRTGAMRSCSGMKATGRRCVRAAMTIRLEWGCKCLRCLSFWRYDFVCKLKPFFKGFQSTNHQLYPLGALLLILFIHIRSTF